MKCVSGAAPGGSTAPSSAPTTAATALSTRRRTSHGESAMRSSVADCLLPSSLPHEMSVRMILLSVLTWLCSCRGLEGYQVVEENLRQMCLWKVSAAVLCCLGLFGLFVIAFDAHDDRALMWSNGRIANAMKISTKYVPRLALDIRLMLDAGAFGWR